MTTTEAPRQGVGAARRRMDRPDVLVLAITLAGLAVVGWLASPFWVAVAVAAQLVVGGLGAVWVIGPVRARYGFARYATFPVAGAAATLLGRQLNPLAQAAATPIIILALFAVLWLELRLPDGRAPRLAVDLSLVGIVFAAAAGVSATFPNATWPPTVLLVVIVAAVPALRAAELRGRYGVDAVGQTMLHLLAVAQIGVVLTLLHLPGVVGSAILALGFHAWGGAAEALDTGGRGWSVLVEFGSLALLGLVVAILLRST